jgi:hypothetical protein
VKPETRSVTASRAVRNSTGAEKPRGWTLGP